MVKTVKMAKICKKCSTETLLLIVCIIKIIEASVRVLQELILYCSVVIRILETFM